MLRAVAGKPCASLRIFAEVFQLKHSELLIAFWTALLELWKQTALIGSLCFIASCDFVCVFGFGLGVFLLQKPVESGFQQVNKVKRYWK